MMKMLPFTLLIASSLFFGCKKDAEAIPDQANNKFNVVFSVSNSNQKTDAATLQTDSLKNFTYYIYTSDGYRVRNSGDSEILQTATSVSIKENLPPGKYKYVFIASDKPLERHIADTPGEISSFLYAGLGNIYQKTLEVTVGEEKINQPVKLDKVNASLELSLLDENIPANIAAIQVTWFDNKYVDFSGASFTAGRKQKNISFMDKSRKPEKFSVPIFNTTTPFTVLINYIDINGKTTFAKEISSIRCYKNEKTALSGYLFNEMFAEFKMDTSTGSKTAQVSAL